MVVGSGTKKLISMVGAYFLKTPLWSKIWNPMLSRLMTILSPGLFDNPLTGTETMFLAPLKKSVPCDHFKYPES